MQFLQIKKFVLLDKTREINNIVYDLLKILFQCTAVSNSGKYSAYSAFDPKMAYEKDFLFRLSNAYNFFCTTFANIILISNFNMILENKNLSDFCKMNKNLVLWWMPMSDLLKIYYQCWLFLVCFLWPKIETKQNYTVVLNSKWPKFSFSIKAMYMSPWV